jgi:hypothetical protein
MTAIARWIQQEQESEAGRVVADPQQHDNRFIFTCAEDIPHSEVFSQVIERNRVTPIAELHRWENYRSLAPEQRLPGKVRLDRDGFIAEGQYAIPPGPIFNTIMELYADQGVVELACLRGQTMPEIRKLKINEFFFPEPKEPTKNLDNTPRTYREIRERMSQIQEGFKKPNAAKLLESTLPVFQQIVEDILRSVAISERFDQQLLDESEAHIELGKVNPQFKQRYDKRDYRALSRLERERKDQVVSGMARNQHDLIEAIAHRMGDQPLSVDLMKTFARELITELKRAEK